MRRVLVLAVFGVGMGSCPALAQQAITPWGGASSRPTSNKQIDLSRAINPPQAPQIHRPFSLGGMFRKFSLPGQAAMPALSPVPPPSAYPSTHFKNGFNPLPPTAQQVPTMKSR